MGISKLPVEERVENNVVHSSARSELKLWKKATGTLATTNDENIELISTNQDKDMEIPTDNRRRNVKRYEGYKRRIRITPTNE